MLTVQLYTVLSCRRGRGADSGRFRKFSRAVFTQTNIVAQNQGAPAQQFNCMVETFKQINLNEEKGTGIC